MASIRINVPLGERSYDVVIGRGLDSELTAALRALRPSAFLLVSDENVMPLHGKRLLSLLEEIAPARAHTVPAGESSKSLARLEQLYDAALQSPALDRGAVIVALGGGVVGDLAGLLAATFLRGIHLVQVPTTLLAMVDSSVGGKTAVNHAAGKNLIGAFHQPRTVICDLQRLGTLPQEEYVSALAEVIKCGVIADRPFFERLEEYARRILDREEGALHRIVECSVRVKVAIVGADERETGGGRAMLNFGHTVGHALEALYPGRYSHGHAVAIGSAAAVRLSEKRAGLAPAEGSRIVRLLKALALPTDLPGSLTSERLLQAIGTDKKRTASGIDFVVTPEIGRAETLACDLDQKLSATLMGSEDG